MSTFIQAIVNGFMVGGIYALIGVSLTLIFGVLKIVNFCQGQLLMVAMYVSYTLYAKCGIDPFFGIPLTAGIMFLFGMFIQSVFITRSMQDDQDSNILFLTVGLGILFENVCLMIFKSDYRSANSIFSNKIQMICIYSLKKVFLCQFHNGWQVFYRINLYVVSEPLNDKAWDRTTTSP